ncbi:MAG: PRC-barrel domain-containing protein [Euryarchaeota archaeon]|nr:PRC-barrel domain-containing protein [Euryarchaeota archaeon]MDE1836092.1 PRC-barrel domain-containing protein [Euryarchaeota archaeon]MDE1879382.1 PRC-barrel domain-containing protein [Euryarchaeota archaeon]MDE2044070.1 PRC-barrel domain-containing protein [Thermoplasmata archaeon]
MLVEITQLVDRDVYTPDGRHLGKVTNIVLDVEGGRADGLFVAEPSEYLVEGSRGVNVPFRWVAAVNDVILLKYFPKRVSAKKASPAPTAPAAAPPPRAPVLERASR